MGTKRLTIEEARRVFKDRGCELLATIYTNSKTPMEYICSCGDIFKMNIDNMRGGRLCQECGQLKSAKKQRHSFSYIKKYYKKRGCELLETQYINSGVKMRYLCSCGKEGFACFDSFKKGHRCYHCGIKKISGENSSSWDPNITIEERREKREKRLSKSPEYNQWRKKVYARDDYTCQKCNERGGILNAHHKDGWKWCKEKRFDVDNGMALCKTHHYEFHKIYGTGNNTEAQALEYIREIKV